LPSDDVWRRFASTENGASPRLSRAIGIWWASANSISRVPFAPRRHHLDRRVQRIGGELEADLVVALAGRAVGDGVGAGGGGDLDEALGDQRPRDGGAEEVLPLVDGVGAEHRKDEVADELLAQVFDEDVLGLHAEELGLAARRLELFALAEVGGEGDDLAAVFGLEPFEDDRGVEPAGIGEDDLVQRGHGRRS
jgi:hypothetical protein